MKFMRITKSILAMPFSKRVVVFLFFFLPSFTGWAQDTTLVIKNKSNWHYLAMPYLMFPSMKGTMGLGTLPNANVDLNTGDIFSRLQMGAMLYAEAGNNTWAITSDFLYMKLNQEVSTTHSDQFKEESRFTFRQVFLDPEKRGNSIRKDALQIIAQLNQAGASFQKSGDPTLLPSEIVKARTTEISNQFGNEFTIQLSHLSKGTWQGPVQSTYGLHLVQLTEHIEGSVPALNEVREAVSREWNNARIREANELFYQELLKNYNVTIEEYNTK